MSLFSLVGVSGPGGLRTPSVLLGPPDLSPSGWRPRAVPDRTRTLVTPPPNPTPVVCRSVGDFWTGTLRSRRGGEAKGE